MWNKCILHLASFLIKGNHMFYDKCHTAFIYFTNMNTVMFLLFMVFCIEIQSSHLVHHCFKGEIETSKKQALSIFVCSCSSKMYMSSDTTKVLKILVYKPQI